MAAGPLGPRAAGLAEAAAEARAALASNAHEQLTLDVFVERFAAEPALS